MSFILFFFYLISFQVAAEVAAPLSQAKKITMVSSGNGTIGAEKLTEEVFNIVTRVPELVKNLTGVDIAKVCLIKINIYNISIEKIS